MSAQWQLMLKIPVKVSFACWRTHGESQQLHPTTCYEPDSVDYLCKGPKKKRNILFLFMSNKPKQINQKEVSGCHEATWEGFPRPLGI